MDWEPRLASNGLERAMEARDIPEADRDEVRRFAEVLERMRRKRAGEEVPPMTAEMARFLKGGA